MDTNVRFASPGVTNPLSKFVLFTSQTGTNQEKWGHKDSRPPLTLRRIFNVVNSREMQTLHEHLTISTISNNKPP